MSATPLTHPEELSDLVKLKNSLKSIDTSLVEQQIDLLDGNLSRLFNIVMHSGYKDQIESRIKDLLREGFRYNPYGFSRFAFTIISNQRLIFI